MLQKCNTDNGVYLTKDCLPIFTASDPLKVLRAGSEGLLPRRARGCGRGILCFVSQTSALCDAFVLPCADVLLWRGHRGELLLTQGAGYGIIVGFGFFFVFLTIALVYGDYRARGGRHYNSEDFNTAGAPQAAGRCIQHAVLSSGFRCTAGSALVF